jgi:O-antigen ligase
MMNALAHTLPQSLRTRCRPRRFALLLLGAATLFPFINPHHLNPIPSFYSEWWAAALGCLAMTYFCCAEARSDLRLPVVALIPLGLILLFLFQLLAGQVMIIQQGLVFALYLLWAMLMALLGRVLAREAGLEALAEAMAWGFLGGGCISLLLVLLQFHGPTIGREWLFPALGEQVFGNLGQRNQFANYLWLGVVSVIYLRCRLRLSPLICAVLAMLLGGAALLTTSRTVYLYAVAIPALTYLMTRRNRLPAEVLRYTLWAGGFILLFSLGKHLLSFADIHVATSGDRLFQEASGTSIRFGLWQVAWNSFINSPWLGVGIGQYSWQTFALAGTLPPGTLPGAAEHAHNLFLQLLAEFGLGSLLLLIIVGVALVREFLRQDWGLAHWWGLAVLVVIGIHSQLEYPLWYAFFLGPTALILGALVPAPISVSLEKLGRPGLGLLFLLAVWVLGNLYRDYGRLEDTLNVQPASPTAQVNWPQMHQRLEALHEDSLFPHYIELYYATLAPISRDNLPDKLRITASALRFSPVDRLVFKYPALLALAGQPREAALMLRMAMRLYPDLVNGVRPQWQALSQRYPELRALLPILDEKTPQSWQATPASSH